MSAHDELELPALGLVISCMQHDLCFQRCHAIYFRMTESRSISFTVCDFAFFKIKLHTNAKRIAQFWRK